jgi:hypothetical protein
MLKNPYDKNGNLLKGATKITRFVKENDGLESIVMKAVQYGYEEGRKQGVAQGVTYLGSLMGQEDKKRK